MFASVIYLLKRQLVSIDVKVVGDGGGVGFNTKFFKKIAKDTPTVFQIVVYANYVICLGDGKAFIRKFQ